MCQPFCGKLYLEMDSKSVGVFEATNVLDTSDIPFILNQSNGDS
jgi:hypothetical protein